jgi:hypothetical protein
MHVIEYRDMITACYHAAMIEDIEKRYRTWQKAFAVLDLRQINLKHRNVNRFIFFYFKNKSKIVESLPSPAGLFF